MNDEHDQALNTLASAPKRVRDAEDPILALDDSIKQSDVREHLKEQVKDVQ